MTILPTEPIHISEQSFRNESLCSLCENRSPCLKSSQFTKEKFFYNFDKITKLIYPQNTPRSADAFYLQNQKIYFIEIKNRPIDVLISQYSEKKKIIEKLLDSIYTVKKNPNYFSKGNIASFFLLCSHLKRNGSASTQINLRALGNTFGITISSRAIEIPIRAINQYSTHVREHHREILTGLPEIVLAFGLHFCDTVSEDIFE